MKKRSNSPQNASKAADFEIHLAESAALSYSRYFEAARLATERGDPGNAHCTLIRQIDEAIETIIPRDPLNRKYALVGDLKSIYRIHKGRMRICWVASPAHSTVYVIFISETLRKDGDANDPYAILSKRVASGEFDAIFQKIGMKARIKPLTNRIQ